MGVNRALTVVGSDGSVLGGMWSFLVCLSVAVVTACRGDALDERASKHVAPVSDPVLVGRHLVASGVDPWLAFEDLLGRPVLHSELADAA